MSGRTILSEGAVKGEDAWGDDIEKEEDEENDDEADVGERLLQQGGHPDIRAQTRDRSPEAHAPHKSSSGSSLMLEERGD